MTSTTNRLSAALTEEQPLQIVGTINAYCALLAQAAGFRAIYLSGAGVANATFGIPDLGVTTLNDVRDEAQRITDACDLPLLVDVDTGWGSALSIARMVRQMGRAGVAAIHLEDQEGAKRCGHRPGKALVETVEMVDRIRSAVDARDRPLGIMARTDAFANEGLEAAIERCQRYIEAGADLIFAEALSDLDQYRRFTQALSVPVLANMTEFGRTPLLTVEEFGAAGVAMVLYPLSAFRAMSQAAWCTYNAIRRDGTQRSMLDDMQTREELYKILDYHRYEAILDRLFLKGKS